MTERFAEIVGNLPEGPYIETGAFLRDCSTCGAKGSDDPVLSEKCRVDTFQGVRPKHAPCLSRYIGKVSS